MNGYDFLITFKSYRDEVVTRKFKKTKNGYVSDYNRYFFLEVNDSKIISILITK